jgi:hypothetical protein
MAAIFISYRRADNADLVQSLYERLVARYGKRRVFRDTSSLLAGDDFREMIRKEIVRCHVVVAVVGREWSPACLHLPNDLVRLELGEALRLGRPIVPVCIDGAGMPRRDDLPDELRGIDFGL